MPLWVWHDARPLNNASMQPWSAGCRDFRESWTSGTGRVHGTSDVGVSLVVHVHMCNNKSSLSCCGDESMTVEGSEFWI